MFGLDKGEVGRWLIRRSIEHVQAVLAPEALIRSVVASVHADSMSG